MKRAFVFFLTAWLVAQTAMSKETSESQGAPVGFPSACLRVFKAIVSPGIFEQCSDAKPQTRCLGLFVERPKGEDNWASRLWRHYPRKISKLMIKDDNYVFSPFYPFPGRQLIWIFNFITGEWALKKISKYLVGAPYTLSRFVTIPLMIWSVGGVVYSEVTPPPEPLEQQQTAASETDYQFAPSDHALIRHPQIGISSHDIRADIYRENGGDPQKMQDVYAVYYRGVESQTKSEPPELFARVNRLVDELKKPQQRAAALNATHMLFLRLRLLDDLYYFPTVFNAQKKIAADNHEVELTEFMSKIQLTDNFLQSAKDAYVTGRLDEKDFLRFSQQYIYNLYLLELADILDQKLVKEQFALTTPLTLFDMTVSLQANMNAAMAPLK